jgi:hypothetical protein
VLCYSHINRINSNFKVFPKFCYFKVKNKLDIAENLASHPTIPLKDSIVNYGMKFLGTPYVTACSKKKI